jgi:hypothetical protein
VITRAVAVAVAVMAPASAGASPSRPALALTATPAHVTLAGAARQVIRVANRGTEPLVVDASPAGFTLGLRGAPRVLLQGVAARRAASWLRIRPAKVVLAGGASAEVGVTSVPARPATPGDHAALVLLTTRPPPGARVGVRMRIGITVVVHVAGRIRHALVLRALHVRRLEDGRMLQLVIANAGNVVESLRSGGIEVSLVARKQVVARLRSPARELLPHSSGVVELRYRGEIRGRVTARVVVTPHAGPAIRRTFRLSGNE